MRVLKQEANDTDPANMKIRSRLATVLLARDARPETTRFFFRLGCILGVAAALRLAYLFDVHRQGVFWDAAILDAGLYRAAGHAIASGQWNAGVFTLGPLYPLVLAGIERIAGPGNTPVYLFQQLLGLATITLTGLIGRRVGGQRVGLLAAGAIAFYPALAQLELKFMSTLLAVSLSTLFLWVVMHARERRSIALAAAAGVVLGLSCLTRANLLLFAPVAAAWLAVRRAGDDRRWTISASGLAATAVMTVATIATIAPATLHNYRASGEPILISSQGGLTFYHANNPKAVGSYSAAEGFSGHPALLDREARHMAERELGRALTRSEIDQYFYRKGTSYLLENPADAILLMSRKLLHWIANAELGTEYVVAMEREHTPMLWLFFVPFAALLGLGVAGLMLTSKPTPDLALLVAMIGTNLVTLLAFYVVSRYRLAALPSLAVLAGLGADRMLAALGDARLRERGLRAAAVAGALAVVSCVPSHAVLRNQIAAEHFNIGNVYFERGEYTSAAAFYERALERMHPKWTAHFNLGLAYARQQAWKQAIPAFEQAVMRAEGAPVAAAALLEARCALEPGPDCPIGLAQSAD